MQLVGYFGMQNSFLHPMVFEKYAKTEIKYLLLLILIFCDFLLKLLVELHKNNEIVFLR